jgi:ribokinase
MAGTIVIAGSCLVALSMKGRRFPTIGETVTADVFLSEAGGKGTNQALAAAKLGSGVSIIGRVGEDSYGERVIATCREFGVNIAGLRTDRAVSTGIAFVMIDGAGRSMVFLAPGANYRLTHEDFDVNERLIRECDIMGFQLETNPDFVDYGIKKAHAMGITTLLDPAPALPIDESVYGCLDFIKPNETEAALLSGIPVTDRDSAFEAAQWFFNRGVATTIITMGDKGVIVLNGTIKEHIVAPKVDAKDTTAAGDIFCGALMHCLAEGTDILESVRFAVYASARSVLTLGAIEAMPSRDQVLEFRRVCGGG